MYVMQIYNIIPNSLSRKFLNQKNLILFSKYFFFFYIFFIN